MLPEPPNDALLKTAVCARGDEAPCSRHGHRRLAVDTALALLQFCTAKVHRNETVLSTPVRSSWHVGPDL